MFKFAALFTQGARERLSENDPADGLISRGEAFGEGDEIGTQLKMLSTEPAAEAPKTADDFIED